MPIIWRNNSSSGSRSAGSLPVTATSCCTLISRPGIKRPRWGYVARRRRKTQLPQRDTPSRSTGQGGILWPVEDTNVSRHLLCIRDGENRRKHTDQKTSRQWAVLTDDVCAAFLLAPGVHCDTQTGGSGSQAADGGASGGSRDKLIFRSTISPETHHLLNWISSQEQQFSTAQVWKSLWNHIGSENQSWFFAVSRGAPARQLQNSRCEAAGWTCVSRHLHSSFRKATTDSCEKPPLTTFFLFSYLNLWTYLSEKKEGEKKKSWHSLFCFLNFLVNWLMIKECPFQSISILQNRKIENL